MLQGLAKAKGLKEYKQLRKNKASLKGLALAKCLKRLRQLKVDLGMGLKKRNVKTTAKTQYADTLLFNKSGQVLLVQRQKDDAFMANKWWIVGGKIEQNETPKQGAIRELMEETGIKLSSVQFVQKVNLPNGGISHRFADLVDNDTAIDLQKDELQAYRWVTVDELQTFDLLGKLSDLQNLIELAKEKIYIIQQWDSAAQHEILNGLLANHDDLARVYNQYFTDNLQGKSVITKIGKVWINGETKKEVRKALDKLKLLTVPYIPEILIHGEIGKPVANKDLRNPKKPKKQKYESFIPFKHTIYIQDLAMEVVIQVGRLSNGGQLSYSLNYKSQFDSLVMGSKKPNFGNAPIDNQSWYQTNQAGYDHMMAQDTDDVNIQITTIRHVQTQQVLSVDEAVELLYGAKIKPTQDLSLSELVIDENASNQQRRKAVEIWLRENLQGKTVISVDGKKVYFNRNKSVHHLVHDGNLNILTAKATSKIVEVLTQGKFIGVQALKKERKDNFVAFHVYRKWVDIDSLQVHLQVKVGELKDGRLEVEIGTNLLAYTQKVIEQDSLPNSHQLLDGILPKATGLYPTHVKDSNIMLDGSQGDSLAVGNGLIAYAIKDIGGHNAVTPLATFDNVPNSEAYRIRHQNIMCDNISQDQDDDVFLEILQVLDKDGNDVTDDVLSSHQVNQKQVLDDDEIEKLSRIPLDLTIGSRKAIAKKWLKDNLLGKSLIASDGKKIRFNSEDTVNHIAFDSRRHDLKLEAIRFIAYTFKHGEALPVETPHHEHQDKAILAFHPYRAWVYIKDYQVLLEVRAVEREFNQYEFMAYSHKIKEKQRSQTNDSIFDNTRTSGSVRCYEQYDNTMFDKLQDDGLIRILKILDKDGNDVTDEILDDTSKNTPLSDDEIEKLSRIVIELEAQIGQGKRQSIVKKWIKQYLLGKRVKTCDGKIVVFNHNDSVSHLSFNARRHHFMAQCVPYIPLVFAKGKFVGRMISEHSRKDNTIIAFHVYQKWVNVSNHRVYLEVHAVERDGVLEYSPYAFKKGKDEHSPRQNRDSAFDGTLTIGLGSSLKYTTPLFDKVQDSLTDDEVLPLRILQVLDENGNDVTDDVLSSHQVNQKQVLDDDEIEKLSRIVIDDIQDMGQGQRKGVAKAWIKDNLLGRTVRTIDGKIVHFNSLDTVRHISYNVRRNALLVQCLPFIPTIFAKGEFVGRELSNHGRVDDTIQAFHLYRKWIGLKNGYQVYAEVQACERFDDKKGELFYAGYNLKALEKKKAVFDGLPYHELHHADAIFSDITLLPKKTSNPFKTAFQHDNALFDKVQDSLTDDEVLPLRILQVLDENGNDVTDDVLGDDGILHYLMSILDGLKNNRIQVMDLDFWQIATWATGNQRHDVDGVLTQIRQLVDDKIGDGKGFLIDG